MAEEYIKTNDDLKTKSSRQNLEKAQLGTRGKARKRLEWSANYYWSNTFLMIVIIVLIFYYNSDLQTWFIDPQVPGASSQELSNIDKLALNLKASGYEVNKIANRLEARQQDLAEISIQQSEDSFIFSTYWSPQIKFAYPELIAETNRLNQKAILARYYIDSEGDLLIEAWAPLAFSATDWDNFIRLWQQETKTWLAKSPIFGGSGVD